MTTVAPRAAGTGAGGVGADARGEALWGLAAGDVAASGNSTAPALAVWDAASGAGVDDPEAFADAVLENLLARHGAGAASGPDDCPALSTIRANGDVSSWPRLAVPQRAGSTVVRAAWLGVHPAVEPGGLATAARTQALVTDAHPVAPVAAELAAALTRGLARGEAVRGRVAAWVRCYLGEARALGPDPVLVRVAGPEGAAVHLAAGWAALVAQLDGPADDELEAGPDSADGALAIAVRLLDGDDDAPTALDRAALRGRGGASAACLAGVFLGAARGTELGTDWVASLRATDREALAARM